MSDNDIINLYSGAQNGGELPYFVGKQYGSGWLKTIGRFALPILKRIGSVLFRTATDVVNDKEAKVLPTLANYAGQEMSKVIEKRKPTTSQTGINKRRKMNTIFQK